ncbi:beta strand repeat-containing protein [Rhodomicrobium sp.]|uniref:beta strand repeat-containing protein n=1 Tax=Rhodomicrobium sp. TaxID=2720632 RepID=UPI0039E4B859
MASVGRANARGRKRSGSAGNKIPARTPETRPAQLSFHTLATLTAAAALLAFAPPVIAGPQGGEVVSGSAAITSAGAATTITQSSQKAIINWTGFSVGANESVTFAQPSYTSATLNRVTGNEKSVIDGALTANGQVFIVNSAGVLFGKSAQVNVGALVASTRDIVNEDFLAGRYTFSGTSSGSVVNQGTIATRDGGYVSLLGKTVSNEGAITATLGTVALASGDKITLNFEGDALADITIDKGTLEALVANKQAIRADGGRVILSAKAADSLVAAQVNNTGIIQARTLADLTGGSSKKGSIKLLAQGGKTAVSGTLDASAPSGGDGGFIETSGDKVTIADSAKLLTFASAGSGGTWLVDPIGFTIGTAGDVTGNFISNYLATQGSYEIVTTHGDIVVNDPITWYKNTLTLTSAGNIVVNSVLSASGTANFTANWGSGNNTSGLFNGAPYGLYTTLGASGTYSGKIDFAGNGSVTLQGAAYSVINSVADFNAIGDATNQAADLAKNYVLGSDLDFENALVAGIGTSAATAFSGNFNGFGHTISNVKIDNTVLGNVPALIGVVAEGKTLSNVAVTGASFAAPTATGYSAILTQYNYGTIANSSVSGSITLGGTSIVGGMVASNYGLMAYDYANVDIEATGQGSTVGVLAGEMNGVYGAKIVASHASGSVKSVSNSTILGGLLGKMYGGAIDRSWSDASVDAGGTLATAGGLVGTLGGASTTAFVTNSYATGTVRAYNAGGFVGSMTGGSISNAYSSGAVTALTGGTAAGFVATRSSTDIQISQSYTASTVSGGTAYGFAGGSKGTLTNVYWTQNGSARKTTGATMLTADDARSLANYAGFDSAYWASSAEGHPILKTIPVTVTLNTAAKTYGESYAASDFTYVGLQWGDTADAFAYAPAASELSVYNKLNAGVHEAGKVLASSGYANIQGYVALNPKTVTVSGATVADKVYDGTTAATVSGGTLAGVEGEDVTTVFRSATYASRNAGTGIAVAFDYGFAYADGTETRNYVAASGSATGAITPKAITADYTVANREYDGTADAAVTAAMLNGVVAGDVVTVASTSAFFADKNAGSWSVTVNGTLSGGDAGNYTLATGHASATITPRTVRLIGSTAYDGNTNVGASDLLVANAVAGDTVTLGGSVSIAGAAKGLQTVADTSGLALSQTGGNYTLAGATGTVWVHGAETTTLSGPSAGTVVSGTASITRTATVTNIAQSSDKAIIEWQRFSVPYTMVVNFDQPNATSVTLNRVIGNEQSVIAGAIKANGTVFIVNTAGVLFSSTSVVNAGSLVASAQALANETFDAGTFVFDGAGGGVSVDGQITVRDGGYVALLGGAVAVNGKIRAAGGDIVLASSDATTLDPATTGRLKSTGTLTGSVKVGGTLDASSATGAGGRIATAAETVTIAQGGHVLAGGNGQAGLWTLVMKGDAAVGTHVRAATLMETLASADVTLKSAAGNIVIGEAFGWSKNTLTLDADKDINVNTVVDIGGSANFNASYGRSGFQSKGSVTTDLDVWLYGIDMAYSKNPNGTDADSFAGKINLNTSGTVRLGAEGDLKTYTVIRNAAELDAIRYQSTCADSSCSYKKIDGYYVLGTDIDLSAYSDWTPIGFNSSVMTGNLEGFGHTVSNLTSTQGGLVWITFGATGYTHTNADGSWFRYITDDGAIRNLGLVNIDIDVVDKGMSEVGGLVSRQGNSGSLRNVFVTGDIHATQTEAINQDPSEVRNEGYVGGVAGATAGYVSNSYSRVNVTTVGYSRVGGFAGWTTGVILDSYATGTVHASKDPKRIGMFVIAGGFAGIVSEGAVRNSYATGNVTGVDYVGGFAGELDSANIYSSYATGNVRMLDSQLYGLAFGEDAYAVSDISSYASAGAGGFVGISIGVIANSSSSGRVSAESGRTQLLGGFAGFTMSDYGGFSVFNAFNKDNAGIANDGRGNFVPSGDHNHGGGSGTPILDAVNQANGTHLTATQFHGGAAALNTKDFGTVTAAQRSGNSVGAAQGIQNVFDGKTATGGSPLADEVGHLGVVGVAVVAAESATPPTPVEASAGAEAVASAAGPDVAASIEGAPSAASDEAERRRRQAASAGARRAPDANYDARLKSIEVEGKRFDLEAKPDAGGATAPQGAPSAPAPKAP